MIKHEVADTEAQDRTHPIYSQLTEQYETAIQRIQKQPRQQVLVKLPERDTVMQAKTSVVPPSRITADTLEHWKRYLAKQRGKACAALEAEIAERTQRLGLPTMQPTPSAPVVNEDEVWQPIGDKPIRL